MKFGAMSDIFNDSVFYDSDGRMFKKEPFTKRIPRKTFVKGRFRGKFHADIIKNLKDNGDFFQFKIYTAEVEIVKKSREEELLIDAENTIKVEADQMPDEILFYEKQRDEKIYYDIKFENPIFHNFQFVSKLQQNEGDEAFGTIEADFYGYLVDFLEEERYRKIYKKINLIKCKKCVPTKEKTGNTERKGNTIREEYYCKGKKQNYWGEWLTEGSPPPTPPLPLITWAKGSLTEKISPCFRNLLLATALIVLSLVFGFTPTFIIGIIWLFYVVFRCYLHWLRYLAYLFGLLFLIGLVYSILNTNWSRTSQTYIPHVPARVKVRPQLVKVINLIGENRKNNVVLLEREMTWFGYNGEKYHGKFRIQKSDLDNSRNYKNSFNPTSYESILYNLEMYDSDRIDDVYKMFATIKKDRNLNDKQFAEMVVSFIQYMPYYVVLEDSCNPNQYQDQMIKELIKQNPGRCSPNQKYGITTPLEFLATGQGDCDSRTLLAHTILKHFGFDAAILSSDIYKHSILGVNLPYNGQVYEDGGSRYTLWETTDRDFKPGIIPSEVRNLNYWQISIK